MGLLDMFTNMNPEQTQGLLAAASQILQQSGDTRRPFGLGQAMGSGIEAYQGSQEAARRRKLEEAQAAQLQKIRAMQIRDGESDFANQEAGRTRAEALRKFYMQNGAGGAGAPSPAAELPPLGSTPMASTPGMPAPQAQQPASTGAPSMYQQRLAMAEKLRAAGFAPEADAQEAAALKFMPKVKNWEKVQQGGKVMFAPYFEDGTSGAPVPLEVAEKLERNDRGGVIDMTNPFTGAVVTSSKKTQTPDSAASNALGWANHGLSKQRLEIDRTEANTKAASVKAPTEFQGKSAAYGLRATEADKILNDINGKYNPAAINSKQSVQDWPLVGGMLGAGVNKALSDNDQRAEQAQRDFVNAVLRQESGAAIGETEFTNAKRQYFPQPGDSQAVITQKARNRQLAIQGLQTNAGRAAMTAPAASTGWSIKKVGD